MSKEVVIPILQAGATAAQLATLNPIGFERQLVFETDTLKAKLLDGVNHYNDLPYVISPSGGAVWGGITGTLADQTDLKSALDAKQATLVSGTNIKTINGNSLLGSGDLVIPTGMAIGDAVTGATPYSVLFTDVLGNLDDDPNFYYTSTTGTLVVPTRVIVPNIRANGSGGLLLENNNGDDVLLLGAGGGQGATFYGGVNIAGALAVDTNVLYVDSTNNRVGIGTATPQYLIDADRGTVSGISNTILNVRYTSSTYSSTVSDLIYRQYYDESYIAVATSTSVIKAGLALNTGGVNFGILNDGSKTTISMGIGRPIHVNTNQFNINSTDTSEAWQFGVVSGNLGRIAQVIQGAPGQSVNLTEWRAHGGDIYSYVSATGVAQFANLSSGLDFYVPATRYIYWEGRVLLRSPADGVLKITNYAENGFDMLQFGGSTAHAPALKKVSADLQVKLADDSDYAWIDVKGVKVQGSAPWSGSWTNSEGDTVVVSNGIIMNVS